MMNNFFELSNLEQFYADNPNSIIFAFLAARYIELGLIDKAHTVAEKGVKQHPTYAFGHYVLGLSYYHTNDLTQAKNHLEQSLAFDNKNPRAWQLMGEMNEKLGMPLQAKENNLNYFLLDPFNRDAVEKFEQEDTQQFKEFESEQASGSESESEEPQTFVEEEAGLLDEESEAKIEELFEDEKDEDEQIDISQRVEEVFKESLGESTLGTDLETHESGSAPEWAEESDEDDFENIDMIETEEEEDEEKVESETDDIDASFEDLFADEEEDESTESENGQTETGESPELNFGKIVFDESSTRDEQQTDSENEDNDLLDFSSVVDEIISEQNEEDSKEVAVEEDQQQAEIDANSAEQEKEQQPQESQPPKSEDKSNSEPTASRKNESAQFAKPPILSPTLGEIYVAQGRFEEAIDVFQQLLKKDPENYRFEKKIKDIQEMLEKQKS